MSVLVHNTGDHAAQATLMASVTKARARSNTNATVRMVPWVMKEDDGTWGYMAWDRGLDYLKNDEVGVSDNDYIMFSEGDSVYSPEMLETALPDMRRGVDLIGFSFRCTPRHAPASGHRFKKCRFVQGNIDLGTVLFRTGAIRSAGLSFAQVTTPCKDIDTNGNPYNCLAPDPRPWWCADWGFISQLVMNGASKKCVGKAALMEQH